MDKMEKLADALKVEERTYEECEVLRKKFQHC